MERHPMEVFKDIIKSLLILNDGKMSIPLNLPDSPCCFSCVIVERDGNEFAVFESIYHHGVTH